MTSCLIFSSLIEVSFKAKICPLCHCIALPFCGSHSVLSHQVTYLLHIFQRSNLSTIFMQRYFVTFFCNVLHIIFVVFFYLTNISLVIYSLVLVFTFSFYLFFTILDFIILVRLHFSIEYWNCMLNLHSFVVTLILEIFTIWIWWTFGLWYLVSSSFSHGICQKKIIYFSCYNYKASKIGDFYMVFIIVDLITIFSEIKQFFCMLFNFSF